MLSKKNSQRIFLASAFLAFLLFGLYHLGKFVTVDEPNWIYERIPQYWQAVKIQDWKATLINDKPGVSLAYISGLGLLWEMHPDLHITKVDKHISEYISSGDTASLFFAFRLPILIINALLSLLIFWLIRKFTENSWLALWTSIFILLSPILLGISQIINPDSLFWIFSALFIFSLFAYLKSEENKYAAFGSISLGLALLSKYTGAILIPFSFLIILIFCFFHEQKWRENLLLSAKIKKFFSSYLFIIAGGLLVFALLLPAVIFGRLYYEEKSVLKILSELKMALSLEIPLILAIFADAFFFRSVVLGYVFKKTRILREYLPKIIYIGLLAIFLFILINWISGQALLKLDVPFDAKREPKFSTETNNLEKIILEFYPVVFSLHPLIIFFLLFLWLRSILKKSESESDWIVFSLSIFLFIYYAAIIANKLLATIRYSIMIYPLLMFLAAVGAWEFFKYKPWQKIKPVWISLFFVVTGIFSLWQVKPFYFNYTNFLLPQKYLIADAWGYGGYEAAQYLNSLPNAENLTVWADYAGTCEFVHGTCIKLYNLKEAQREYKIDYYVLTRRGRINYAPSRARWRRSENVDAYKYYDRTNPVWELQINGRPGNYIRIFKADPQN